MNHETLKLKAFPFSLKGWAKQWYKLHVSSCHASWVILKDQFCFAFFPLSKIIDLHNEVLNFSQKEGESLGAAWSRYNQDALSGPELSILYAMSMQHFMHGLGTESTEFLDMTSGESLFIARLPRIPNPLLGSLPCFAVTLTFCESKFSRSSSALGCISK
jgi:hypothetical protein